MKEEVAGPSDMTKCIAYKACGKTPDWSNEATPPPATEPPATEPPATDPSATQPVPDCCDTLVRGNPLETMFQPELWTKVSFPKTSANMLGLRL